MFSSSFVSSAASGVETRTICVADEPVQRLRAIGAGLRSARRPPSGVLRSVKSVRPGSTRSGENARWKSRPAAQAGLLEQRRDALARRAGIGGRLEHHQLVRLQHLGERARRVEQRAEVGLAVGRQRRRHADRAPRRPGQAARSAWWHGCDRRRSRSCVGGDVLDVGVAGRDRLDLARVDVDGDDVAALLRERHGERQADVAESDDADGASSRPV